MYIKMRAEVRVESKSKERKASPKIELLANKAINFLAPYFEININNIRKDNLPKVFVSDCPFYYKNKIYLQERITSQNSSIIGHEVGHWFHNFINPKLFRISPIEYIVGVTTKKQFLLELLRESVASYSEIIYQNKRDTIQNPKFSLLELVKMDLSKANLKREDLNKFYIKDILNLSGD